MQLTVGIAQKPGDVREELAKYGRKGTAQKFNSVQSQRRDIIMKQRDSGLLGKMTRMNQDNKPINKDLFSFKGN